MLVAAVQYDIVWEDKPANHRKVERMLDEAEIAPGTFVLLPELGDTGFSFNLDVTVDDRSLSWAKAQAKARGVWIQVGYAERGPDDRGRNCATIITPEGEAAGTYRKVHPFSYGKEIEYFTGGDELLLSRMKEAVVCPLICYDLRFPELWRLGVVEGAELFTIGASWPAPRQHHWRTLLIARAIENQTYILAVNRVGRDPHLSYLGGSIILAPDGEILAEAGSEEEVVLKAELDFGVLRSWREKFPALNDVHRAFLGEVKTVRT